MQDDHGDRMKSYEAQPLPRTFDRNLPIYVRVDGRAFSKFTWKMEKPFDPRFSSIMRDTAYLTAKAMGADICYTQSDEISFVMFPVKHPNGQRIFGDRADKLLSIYASTATATFISMAVMAGIYTPGRGMAPTFDARVCQMPSLEEAVNMLIWRIHDARRNSISSMNRWILHKRKTPTQDIMREELRNAGHAWEDLDDDLRYGRLTVCRSHDGLTPEQVPVHIRMKEFVECMNFEQRVRQLTGQFEGVSNLAPKEIT